METHQYKSLAVLLVEQYQCVFHLFHISHTLLLLFFSNTLLFPTTTMAQENQSLWTGNFMANGSTFSHGEPWGNAAIPQPAVSSVSFSHWVRLIFTAYKFQ
jgi:hypothetical protein